MKCKHTKENGEQCNANAMSESEFCYLHNPDISEETKKEAQARGGSNRAVVVKEPLPEMPIKKMPDVALLLADTISRVRAGKMDTRIATTLGYLAGHLTKALEASELEERFEKLEKLVNEQVNKR